MVLNLIYTLDPFIIQSSVAPTPQTTGPLFFVNRVYDVAQEARNVLTGEQKHIVATLSLLLHQNLHNMELLFHHILQLLKPLLPPMHGRCSLVAQVLVLLLNDDECCGHCHDRYLPVLHWTNHKRVTDMMSR